MEYLDESSLRQACPTNPSCLRVSLSCTTLRNNLGRTKREYIKFVKKLRFEAKAHKQFRPGTIFVGNIDIHATPRIQCFKSTSNKAVNPCKVEHTTKYRATTKNITTLDYKTITIIINGYS